jgi:hypothetical protein
MVTEVLQVFRELTIPVRNIRSVDKMLGPDVFDRMRELSPDSMLKQTSDFLTNWLGLSLSRGISY